jgi:hypothetical protein
MKAHWVPRFAVGIIIIHDDADWRVAGRTFDQRAVPMSDLAKKIKRRRVMRSSNERNSCADTCRSMAFIDGTDSYDQ